MEIVNEQIWTILETYLSENPNFLVKHHIDSYNRFYKHDIYSIFKESNPIRIVSEDSEGNIASECNLYIGGKDGRKVYFGKPAVYDGKGTKHFLFPNEARLRNMTYGMTIHYDVDIEITSRLGENDTPSLHGGNEFMKRLKSSELEIIEENENEMVGGSDSMRGGVPKNPVMRVKRAVVSDINQIRTTPSIAKKVMEEADKSISFNDKGEKIQTTTNTYENVLLGRFPIMVQSDFCILKGMTPENRFSMGECPSDKGGYFIIDGQEKVVVSQEKFSDNVLYVRDYTTANEDDTVDEVMNEDDEDNEQVTPEFLYSAQIVSVSENSSKFARTFSIKMIAPTKTIRNMNIVVNVPNVKKPVPLFILFRALGIISDKSIIEMCLLDMDKYEAMIDLLIPSVHDSGGYNTQAECLNFIGLLTKGMTISHAHEILIEYLLPHVGRHNYREKAYYLGYMVFKVLCVKVGIDKPTDRDNFKHKRIELVGPLLFNLFNEYYKLQSKSVQQGFEQELYYSKGEYKGQYAGQYSENLSGLISEKYEEVFKNSKELEVGVSKAFKGNWGAHAHTKRQGIVQGLDRLSFNSMMSHLRKIVLPLDPQLKVVEPRKLHSSQWGFIDPIDTPDGANIGFHKNLAISTQVTRGYPSNVILKWLNENITINSLEDCDPLSLSKMSKVFVNGCWIGGVDNPLECVEKMVLYRRNGLIPIYTSVTFKINENIVYIFTDGGRLCRPIFYLKENELFVKDFGKISGIMNKGPSWNNLITGFNKKNIDFDPNDCNVYELKDLYENSGLNNPALYERFKEKKAVIDYIDCSETENALIAVNTSHLNSKTKKYTHCEIHESLIFGMMGNQITFPETNPMARNLFSCGQSKQACSVYHTNYQMRMDKSSMVLNYGQSPLLQSRYGKYINNNENSYGENAIVAIMCYTGYNVEDAILINEGALSRGLFRTSYFTTYETHEEKVAANGVNVAVDKNIGNVDNFQVVQGKKVGYVYHKLDSNGMIREGEIVDDKTVLIGMTSNSMDDSVKRIDHSVVPKKGQLGTVYKAYITEGDVGTRIGKIRIVDQRIPTLGDKFASRVGQKGTIGMVIREVDMPFTSSGLRPDLIINPHAIPSRMTIGQLVESITGKACALYGGIGDCTAFNQKGIKVEEYGKLLVKAGFHSKGSEIMYDGMTGQQIETEIFIGPTYYMRLKHMVKDKINYRRQGPNEQLTRQSVGGRANDGGLRIGEMEKDSIVSYGATNFLTESMMERGDKYHLAVCNKSGMTAIYNPTKKIFLSPIMDGPIKFTGLTSTDNIKIENVSHHGRDFSVISVPYTLKLLIQELGCMNIQLRIITEDNIEQLENLASSFDTTGMNMGLKVNVAKKQRIVDKTENETNGTVDDWNVAIDDVVSNSVAEIPEPETIPEVKITPEPNIIPVIGETIYGWTLYMSAKYNQPFWSRKTSSKTFWEDPPEIVIRKKILNLESSNKNFSSGDSVYYLGGDMNDPNLKPDIVWKIESISRERKVLSVSEMGDPSNKMVFPNFDVELLRHVNKNPDPLMKSENMSVFASPLGEMRGGDKTEDYLVDEIVYLVNDKKVERPWHITGINNGRIIITTDDIEGLNSEEIFKTVLSSDVYRPQNPQTQQLTQMPMNGGILFAPVIKVFNGGNDTTDDSNDSLRTGDGNIPPKKEMIFKKESIQEDKKPEKSTVDSILDFTKSLIVKKMP
jgi:DNA-directed RNA polymerase II subunit RPB2